MIKVNFIWSSIYEQTIHAPSIDEEFDYKKSKEFVNSFIKEIEPLWKKIEDKIFNYCENMTDLKWKKKEIVAYVIKISSIMPISNPLTIPIQFKSREKIFTLSKERFIDMMIHELIHNLFIQNEKEMKDYFNFILKKYKDENFNTSIHLLLHAIHKKIFIKFFKKERLNQEIEMNKFYPDYKRSWEIVKKEGENKIINDFKNYLRFPNTNA